MLAVLDANVLYPFQLRNLLLHLAAVDAFQPLWSDLIIEEVKRNLKNKVMSDKQWNRLDHQMRSHFAEAWGRDFESDIEGFDLPDPNDRHVLALAVHYEADTIVTWNTKDFPKPMLQRFGLRRERPPTFVERLWQLDEDAVYAAARLHRRSLTISMLSPIEYLTSLREHAKLRSLARRLENSGFLDQ